VVADALEGPGEVGLFPGLPRLVEAAVLLQEGLLRRRIPGFILALDAP
jgi:hypothetical protein